MMTYHTALSRSPVLNERDIVRLMMNAMEILCVARIIVRGWENFIRIQEIVVKRKTTVRTFKESKNLQKVKELNTYLVESGYQL